MLGLTPTQTYSQFPALLMGLAPHSETIVNATPLLGFPPLGVQMFAGTADGITLTQKQQCKLFYTSFPTDHTRDRV